MKKNKMIVVALAFFLVFVSFPQMGKVKAQASIIYIRSDGSVEGTDKIQQSGNVYTFLDDIYTNESSGISIEKSNIVIDGAGYTLQGACNRTAPLDTRISRYGIHVTNEHSITVRNLNIKNYGDGIFYFLSSYSSIIGNNITDCRGGIFIYGSVNNTLKSNNLVNNNEHFDISCDSMSEYYHDIDTTNLMDGKPFYYWINKSNCIVPKDAGFVFLIQCTNMSVCDIEFSGNDQNILLKATTNSTIQNNVIVGNGKNRGIHLEDSNNNKICNNTVKEQAFGILLEYSSNNVVEKNQVTDSGVGIKLTGSNNNTVVWNKVKGTIEGIYVAEYQPSEWFPNWYEVSGNMISSNQITDGTNGITAHGKNTVDGNVITGNSDTAIKIDTQTTVTNNFISNNSMAINVAKASNFLKNNTMTNNGYSLFFPEFHSSYWRMDYVQILVNDIDESNTVDGKPVCYWVNKHNETVPANAGYVILVNCINVTVQNLNLKSNKEGIILVNTTHSKVYSNVLSENQIGLGIFASTQNMISENLIKNNSVGVRIGSSTYNTITSNNITMNTAWGIEFKGGQTNNTIYNNNFVDNGGESTLQVSIDKLYGLGLGNFWNNGTIGNYWSDYFQRYPQASINGTFVGDTPYYINENNQDDYPLMTQIELEIIPEFQPLIIIPLLIAGTTVALIQKKKLTKQPQNNKTSSHRMLKPVSVLLLLSFIGAALVLVTPTDICAVQASTVGNEIPKPDVPEFTVEVVDNSYDVPTTYSIDPSTGANITHEGYHVESQLIELIIKNQPFTPHVDEDGNEINLHFNVRVKKSFESDWTELNTPDILLFRDGWSYASKIPPQSSSEDTVYAYSADYPNGTQLDYQVRAQLGYYTEYYPYVGVGASSGWSFHGEFSDWSSTQTLILDEPVIPEFQPWTIIPLLIGGTAVALIQKKKLTKQPQKHNKTNRYRTLKPATCLLLLSFLGTGLLIAFPTKACVVQASTEPSVPEFTIKFVDNSYDVPTTYSIDPFTGENITHYGYHVDKRTIEVTIKNQPFTSTNIDGNSTKLVYVVSWKGHFGDYWTDDEIEPSNFDYTVKTYTLGSFGNVPADGQIDFRVSAIVGYSYGYYGDHPHIIPIAIKFQAVAISDPSSIQTFSFAENAVIPEFPSWFILPLFLTASVVITFCKKKLNKNIT